MKLNFAILPLVLVSALLTGCAQPMHEPSRIAEEPLVWPQPPLPPRIEFIASVSRPLDLGIKPPLYERLKRLVGGKEQPGFIQPGGVTVDQGVIFVADPGAQCLWILKSEAGSFKRVFSAGKENLVSPVAVAVGRDGRLYLTDSYLAKVFVYRNNGELLTTIGEGKLERPAGVAYDRTSDRLYVADSAAHRILIFSGTGQAIGSIGQRGAGKGEFNFPTHIAVDQQGTLYVTDSLGFRVQMFAPDGQFQAAFGHHSNVSGDFAAPKGVAVDSDGHVYVVDALFETVQIFDKAGQLLLNFGERGIDPGQFWLPSGIFIDANDRIYVADTYNQRIQIFQYLGRKQQ